LNLQVTGLFRIRKQGGGLVVNAFYLINAIGGCDSAASGIVPTQTSHFEQVSILPCQVFPADANSLGNVGFRRSLSLFSKSRDCPLNPPCGRCYSGCMSLLSAFAYFLRC
jgi:hypothetical protein